MFKFHKNDLPKYNVCSFRSATQIFKRFGNIYVRKEVIWIVAPN